MGNRATGSLLKDSADHESSAHPPSISAWVTSIAVLGVKFPGNRSHVGTEG